MTNNLIDKQMGEFEKKFTDDDYIVSGVHATEYKSFLRSSFLAILESIGEEVVGMEKEEFIEVFDNSSHRYQISRNKREDWFKWCEIPSDDEASWDAPDYAKRIDGMPIEENGGYNKALSDLRLRLTEIIKTVKKEGV